MEHVKAPQKEKKDTSYFEKFVTEGNEKADELAKEGALYFEKFVTEGNEKADELAKEGALLDKGFMADARAETMQWQHAASFHCLVEERKDCQELKPTPKEKWTFVDQQREETKHRTEWCAEADQNRCMRCGREEANT